MYPVVFVIPGWGGTHYDVYYPAIAKRYGFTTGKEKIFVYLNPETNNPFGLHAFIDSRVNGPWGKALVEELIPYLAKHYRISTNSNQHFIAGQSSGGYAALWLQLHYPSAFGGSWAVSPDPVDFSDFTSVNLYAKSSNMYYDTDGKIRPFFLMNGQYIGTIKNYASFEHFLGNGGQMQSFEAAFGLMDKKTGKPRELFNRQTGIINPGVLKTWQSYNLGDFFIKNYAKLASKIDNRIFVYAGADDNFFLNRSVEIFKQKAAKLNAKVTVELIPGANHWTVWSEWFTQQMHKDMDAKIE
jgi:S-formylglutathione hydrolase FrmB